MLDPQSWLPAAQELELGQRNRVEHDCGSGRVMLIENKAEGWSAWCHRCSEKGWHPKPQPSLKERVAALQTAQTADDKAAADITPPMPAEFEPRLWPMPARVWLYKAGLSNERIEQLGFYWSPDMRRVVMPVLNDQGRLVYWQARAFDTRFKYINPPVDKPLYKQGSGPLLVLTEDILSAARVGEVTAAWSLLGTSADDRIISDIVATGLPVRVWLDPDKAGLKGRRKLVPRLRAYGVDAVSIKTAQDPKFYSNEEIRQFLKI